MTNDRNDLVHTEAVEKRFLCSFSQIRTAKKKEGLARETVTVVVLLPVKIRVMSGEL